RWPAQVTPLSEAFRAGIAVAEPRVTPLTRHAMLFLGSVQSAGWIARLYLLVLLLRPVILRSRAEAPHEAVERLFRQHGRRSLSAFAVLDDKNHRLVADARALVAYA